MAYPNALELCRSDLFTKEDELRQAYPQLLVDKVLRVRDMYNWCIANPDAKDRQFVEQELSRYDISKVVAYSDLAIVKTLLPTLATASRDFHRWRYNEMILKHTKWRRSVRTPRLWRKQLRRMRSIIALTLKMNRQCLMK